MKSPRLSATLLPVAVLASIFVAIASASIAQSTDEDSALARKQYMGRTIAPYMDYSGASWLIRETRAREEHPRKLLKALSLKPGQKVCDFGCGNGYYTLELAKLVGPRGEVVAVDIQPEMLEMIRERIDARALTNIRPVLATAEKSGLDPQALDLVLLVDVYHELDDPVEVLAEIAASLKPSGRIAVVEFRAEDPTVPIRPLHKMTLEQVHKEFTANNLKLVGQYDGLPWQHVAFFARADSPLPAAPLRPWAPPTDRVGPHPAVSEPAAPVER